MRSFFSLYCFCSIGFSGGLCVVVQEQSACSEVSASDHQEASNGQRKSACDNFYQHVCASPHEAASTATPESLKDALYRKLEAILEEDPPETGRMPHVEDSDADRSKSVKTMAKGLYWACRKALTMH
uniref:Putative secreted protein n=1 Tax=Amblyomma cajennense TaxID=34607 RepID=A0A023FCK2_AMBCJ